MVHIKPFTNLNLYWANQFSNFFDVENYEVPGYVLPKFKMDLNLHLENILLAYDHSSIISNSPMQLRYFFNFFLSGKPIGLKFLYFFFFINFFKI